MRFAFIDDKRVEATPQTKALCPGCFQAVIAKCGLQRIHHWSHSNNKNCDSWWEPETEWHRNWKDKFPQEWQEIPMRNKQTEELHIADIRTSHGVTIEFQHSHIEPNERISREKFYQNLIWVIDGTRLKNDFKRFVKEKKNFMFETLDTFRVDYIEETFPSAWVSSSVPVIFDFLGVATTPDSKERSPLYCLYPKRIGRYSFVEEIPRNDFIKIITKGEWLLQIENFTNLWQQLNHKRQIELALLQAQDDIIRQQNMNRIVRNWNRRRRW